MFLASNHSGCTVLLGILTGENPSYSQYGSQLGSQSEVLSEKVLFFVLSAAKCSQVLTRIHIDTAQ